MDKKKKQQINQVLEYFKGFDFTDIIGFARILGVEEDKDFDQFVTNIMVAFADQEPKRRRQLLKLAKDIVLDNKTLTTKKKVDENE